MRDLATTLSGLYASEINCGLSSFWDGGFTVWLGDGMNGRHGEGYFDGDKIGEAADWLHEQALIAYPGSEYAKGARIVDEATRLRAKT
jgi:hypothetical protein